MWRPQALPIPSTSAAALAKRGLLLALLSAPLMACESARDAWRSVSSTAEETWGSLAGTEPNLLLQSREGRVEIASRCQSKAQIRWPNAQSVRFADGHITNSGTDGDAEYLGAVEVVTPAGGLQRFRFVCTVQPDGVVGLRFL
ncbi:MAG: hypothetical protein HYR63_28065 [Proteobacteria bacterium]|nr:hypothetical protein [Pseudomonadota bacterium]MBI3497945.1 hypothetical protein [Pseudomonadota bacterium]